MQKNIFLLISAIILLTACGSDKPVDVVTEEPSTDLSDRILDESIYKEAVASNDLEKCGLIVDLAAGKECKQVVEAQRITEKAVADMDKDSCSKVEIERYKEYCINGVKEAVANKEKEDNLEKELAQNSEIDSQAIAEDDEKLCEKIEDENQRNSCLFNVLANRAITKSDASICDRIPTMELVESCKASLNASF